MRKRVLMVVMTVLLLLCVVGALYACESYKTSPLATGGEKDAIVESNGGLVVKQGKYLYFVNGYTGYLTELGQDNWFGNVTKGAIARVTYNADGTLSNDVTIVVPKSVMASSENVGFSIFGNWIYYVSPGSTEDRSGTVQTDTLQFMRTKLDGTGTQVILNWDDTSVKYKYTASALVFYDSTNRKLYSKDLSASSFKASKPGECIAEDVSAVHFIKNETYDPKATGTPLADYILYTKNSEDALDASNTLYAIDPLGKNEPKVVIGADTYNDAKYNVSVLASYAEADGGLSLYYTKTYYITGADSGEVVGTYAYRFTNSFDFAATNEVRVAVSSLSSLFPLGYDEGVVQTSGNAKIYYTDGADPKVYGELSLSTLITVQQNAKGVDSFYFLNGDSILEYYPLDDASNAHFAYDTKDKFMSGFTGAEYFDGYIYFILDDDYDYMARIKIADIDVYSGKSATIEKVAKYSAEDQAAIDKAAASEEEK